ncbi:MAG: B12-binding domain-containing radical SAM protein, partial [Chloroflexi bacterium]
MKILLVNPPYNIPIETRASPPLGLAYLAAISESKGHEVRAYDGEVDPEPLEQVVRNFNPDVVGITATTVQIKRAWKVAEKIKELCDIPVILGGVHPTLLPEDSVSHPAVDIVVRGEGEYTWEELISALEKGCKPEDLEKIQGLTFKTPSGEIVSTPDRPVIQDLDSLPFPVYHCFKMYLYTNLQPTIDHLPPGRSFPIMTSRGCPYRCSYCSQIGPRRWRMRSPENVVAEWRWLVKEMGALEIGVLDDTFNIDRERVIRICDLLIKEKLNRIPWIMINGIRANLVDKELLRKMREAGCIRTAFGVESGDQRILDEVIHKQLTLEQIRNAFKWAKEVGMET